MIAYLLLSAASLIFLLAIYQLFLKKKGLLTFNRFYLLAALILSLTVPLLEIEFEPKSEVLIEAYQELGMLDEIADTHQLILLDQLESNQNNLTEIFILIYVAISSLLLLRLLINLGILLASTKNKGPQIAGMQTVLINKKSNPYSFFNYFFIPFEQFEEIAENKAVLWHEKAHSVQFHSIDRLILEVVQAIFWINPIIYLYKKAIKTNHEFLADEVSCHRLNEKNDYLQQLLLFNQPGGIQKLGSAWGYLTLKNRIKMIQKQQINPIRKSAYISLSLLLTVLILTTTAFKPKPILKPLKELEMEIHIGNEVPSILPIKKDEIKEIKASFGMRMHPVQKVKKMHTGIDIIAPAGTAIIATADGVVETASYGEGYGKHIKLKHNDTFSSMYAHLSEFKVQTGDRIQAGDVIGIIGTTGRSMGIHLHYEVIKDGKKVNPEAYFNRGEE